MLALLLALVLAAVIAEVISRRLRRIVRFAEQVAAGDLSARIAVTSGDEIAQVAIALDRTARRLEENFAAVRESRSELEALLNSMTDGVIAVSPDMKVRWANHAIAGILHQQVRIGVPLSNCCAILIFLPQFMKYSNQSGVRDHCQLPFPVAGPFPSLQSLYPMAALLACCMTFRKLNAWKKHAEISSPMFPTNCARR